MTLLSLNQRTDGTGNCIVQYQYQSQIYLARASFVIKNAIGGATWEWGANCPCDGGSSMSSSETWNTEVCCAVVAPVVIHSRFVVQPQKSDGDQMKCQCEEPLAGPSWKNAEIEVVHTALTCSSGKEDYRVLLLWNIVWLSWIQFGDEQATNEVSIAHQNSILDDRHCKRYEQLLTELVVICPVEKQTKDDRRIIKLLIRRAVISTNLD